MKKSNYEANIQASELEKKIFGESEPNYLFMSLEARKSALAAVKDGDYDEAWRCFHQQKEYDLMHCTHIDSRGHYSARDILSREAKISEDLANVLRLQGKNKQALAHIVYWISANYHEPIKKHSTKLKSYFNKCKFSDTTLEQVRDFISAQSRKPDFRKIQLQVQSWT